METGIQEPREVYELWEMQALKPGQSLSPIAVSVASKSADLKMQWNDFNTQTAVKTIARVQLCMVFKIIS